MVSSATYTLLRCKTESARRLRFGQLVLLDFSCHAGWAVRGKQQTGSSTASVPRVGIGWIHPFLEILGEVGAPCEELLERANLPVLAVDDGSLLVPTARIYDFVALARNETGMADLGLQAGGRLDIESLLPDPEHAWARPGVFRSIESFIGVALESSSNVEMWVEQQAGSEGAAEFFYLGTYGPDHPAFSSVEQYMLALMMRLIRHGAGPGWSPARVNLRASSVPEGAIRQLAGDARTRCDQDVTSIVFWPQQFLGPMQRFPDRSSPVWRRHRRTLEAGGSVVDLAGSLRLVLRAYLPDGSPDIQQAARLSGTSVRTLQRRLKKEGFTYSRLLDGLRHDLAVYLLRDPSLGAAAVSQELGYRDAAIFTRAFRRWTGTTPSKFRRSVSLASTPHGS